MSSYDYGPTRVLSITVTSDGVTHLMWWPRAREVTLSTEAVWLDTRWGAEPLYANHTLTVCGVMQMIVARTMAEAWAAAQERWAEEDAALSAPLPAIGGGL